MMTEITQREEVEMMKKSIVMIVAALMIVGFASLDEANAAVKKKKQPTNTQAVKEEKVDPVQLMETLSKEISSKASDVTAKMTGKLVNIKESVNLSSGNILADGFFNAGSKFELIYSTKVETLDLDSNKIILKIIDGEIFTKQDTFGSGNKGRAADIIENNRGKEVTRDLDAVLNGLLWPAHEKNKFKKEDIAYAIWIAENARSLGNVDTGAWVLLDQGFPRLAVVTYMKAIEKANSNSIDTSKYAGYLSEIKSKGDIQEADFSSPEERGKVLAELKKLNGLLIKL